MSSDFESLRPPKNNPESQLSGKDSRPRKSNQLLLAVFLVSSVALVFSLSSVVSEKKPEAATAAAENDNAPVASPENEGNQSDLEAASANEESAEITNASAEAVSAETTGEPSDEVVGWLGQSLQPSPEPHAFRRGQVLESRGYPTPGGTLIFPIKFEKFALAVYLSQDEFGDWRYYMQDDDQLFPITKPRSAEEIQKSEEAAREKAKADKAAAEERAANSQRMIAEIEARKTAEGKESGATLSSKTESPMSPSESPTSGNAAVQLAERKARLAEVESKIAAERQRWQEATNTINRLTNFKKTPVREGSDAYYKCLEASRIIKEVESGASELVAQKVRYETLVKEYESK